ncbi:MAG: PqqD family peptide modification chaperone [Anaerolineae bacterium]|nr:PqqD family peptide modification chaperone [Anaerolineae bacterium]
MSASLYNDLHHSKAIVGLSPHMAFEHFVNQALLLDLHTRTFTRLNADQSWIVQHIDGRRPLATIMTLLARTFCLDDEQAYEMVDTFCKTMLQQGHFYLKYSSWQGEIKVTHYVQNPDVNIREEDSDGALLFNPDTNQVQVLNSSGMYIWKMCAKGCTVTEIITAIKANFEDVPDGEVESDVEEFIAAMTNNGFLGVANGS